MTEPLTPEAALIDPMLLWGEEDEDEWGNEIPGALVLAELQEVEHGGERWVTSVWSPLVMVRRDVLRLADEQIATRRSPDQMWYADGRPVLERPTCRFQPDHVGALGRLGVKILPIVPGAVPSPSGSTGPHLVHAVLRGEDWIGFVMGCRGARADRCVTLPDSMVCDPVGAPVAIGGDQ